MEFVDDVGQCWRFVMDSPAAMFAACRQSVRRWRLARLTAALPHLAPDACDVAGRPDVDTVLLDLGVEASKLVSSRAKRAVVEGFIWDPKWRGDLASACCGGQWPQARRAKLVRGEFDIRCQLCFEAPGTLSHRFVCRVTRPNAGWPGPPPGADLLRNQLSEERARTLDTRGLLVIRVPAPTPPVAEWFEWLLPPPASSDDEDNWVWYIDGSMLRAKWGPFGSAGFGIVVTSGRALVAFGRGVPPPWCRSAAAA